MKTFQRFGALTMALSAVTLLMAAGCSSKKGPQISGSREAIFLDDDPIVADATLSSSAVSIPSATPSSTWESASGNVSHAMDSVRIQGAMNKVWSTSVGRGSDGSSRLLNGPVASNGVVYTVDTRGHVVATQIQTGKRLWEKDSTPSGSVSQAFSGGLALEGDRLFAVTPNAEVVMMDTKSGEILSKFELSAPARSAPTVKNGSIYVVNINNQLEVLNYRSGHKVWSHTGIMEIAGLLGGASPALTPELLVVPYTSGEVYALHPGSGTALWRENMVSLRKLDPISTLFHIKARPVVKGNHVYLIGNGGIMKCLDANTGNTIWQQPIGGSRSPAVTGNYLFMVSNANELVCMDRFTGGVYWVRQLPKYRDEDKREHPILWAGPILVNDTLVFSGSNGQAMSVSVKDGSDRQTLDLGHKTLLSPIAVDNTVLFLTDRAELVAFQ